MRRILKTPSNSSITDALLIDYLNRFWICDVDARLQMFDFKTKYNFQTTPGVDRYNMPLYDPQIESTSPNQTIGMYPVYQGFLGPCYVSGVEISFETQQQSFFRAFPNIVQNPLVVGQGNGTAGPYTFQVPFLSTFTVQPNPPFHGIIRGHVDMAGIIATGNNIDPPLSTTNPIPTTHEELDLKIPVTSVDSAVYITSIDATGQNVIVQDSGQFLQQNVNYGLLMKPGKAPYGNLPLGNGVTPNFYDTTHNTVNYQTGVINVLFPAAIPVGQNITVQCYFYQNGLPRSVLYYNNTLTLRVPPAYSYLVELTAYLTPAAFFNTEAAIPFAYMAEYIARGAARKVLSDTGDVEQMQFYEPLFREQELLVWKRSQRQWTSTRTQTIYSRGNNSGQNGSGYYGSNF